MPARLGGRQGAHVQQRRVLIDHGGRLSAAIALGTVKIQRGHAMLAEGAFEGGSAVDRFGGVVSHNLYSSPVASLPVGQEVCDLGVYLGIYKEFSRLRLIVQHDVEQRTVDFEPAVVVNESQLPEPVHEKLTRDRVVPTISARVSWLIFGTTVWGTPALPKWASRRRMRASRFSLELNNWSTRSSS